MKQCRTCRETKPLSEFHPRAGSSDGYRNDCKACCRARSREYHERNRDSIRARKAANYQASRNLVVEQRREFRARHGDEINRRRRERHATDPEYREREAARRRARYAANPGPTRERVKQRDFRRRNVRLDALVDRDGAICGLCGLDLDLEQEAHVDHIVQRAHGGSNALENLQLAHPSCNRRKNGRAQQAAPTPDQRMPVLDGQPQG